MPIAERQAELIADHLDGTYRLPSQEAMEREIDRHKAGLDKRYVASKRHTIQVDFDDYMRQLRRERRHGRRRAAGRTPTDRPLASIPARIARADAPNLALAGSR